MHICLSWMLATFIGLLIRNLCKMSAHDFQAKFASAMESILQSAIAETTKLFEAVVGELKADMSRIKKDNDELKAKCSQFECAQKGAAAAGRSHRAVQCDIISVCNKVAERSRPAGPNQCSRQKTFYPLREHDYDGRAAVGHKEGDPAYRRGAFAVSPGTSQSETERGGASTKTRELLLKLPDLGMYIRVQGGQNRETGSPVSGPPPKSARIVRTSLQPGERYTSVALQDARLLVEAMSSSVEGSVLSSKPSMAGGPTVGAPQTRTDGSRADLQVRPRSAEGPTAVHSLLLKGFAAAAAAAAAASQEGVNVTRPSGTKSQVRASGAAPPAAAQPRGSPAPSKGAKRRPPPKVPLAPRLALSLVSCKRAAAAEAAPARAPAPAPTSAALQGAHGALRAPSVPVKTPLRSSSASLPVSAPTVYRNRPWGVQQSPLLKMVFPAPQTAGVVPEPGASGRKADGFPSSQGPKPPSEPPAPPATAPAAPQKEPPQSRVSANPSGGFRVPAAWHIKPFAVVRLARLPFAISKEESVLVSQLPLGAGWDSLSGLDRDTGSSRWSGQAPPVRTGSTSGASAPLANLPQKEVTRETGQPKREEEEEEEEESSKKRRRDSTSCSKTGGSESKSFQEDGFQPHPKAGRVSCQHAETQTVSRKKPPRDPQDCKIRLDLLEIAEAVESLRTNRDSSVQKRKSGLPHGVTERRASAGKDPDDDDDDDEDLSGSKATAVPTTALCTSPAGNAATRSAQPGFRHPDTGAAPRSPRRTGSSPDTGRPKRAASDPDVTSRKPKAPAAESASALRGLCPSAQPGSPLGDGRIGPDSLGRRANGGHPAGFKPSVGQKSRTPAETAPHTSLGGANAKRLAKKAKATVGKRKALRQLHNRAKSTRLEAGPPSGAAARKIRSAGVWVPPVGDAAENQPESDSPKAPDGGGVPPPGLSLHPPAEARPVVSPSRPLSLIGSRLLKNQCGVCGRVLGSTSALESHVGLHKRRPFSCRLCGKNFADTKALKRHGRVHRNAKIHACPKCGKAFVYKFSLTKHLQTVHRRIKPFLCQMCGKSFFTKLEVESHIRVHTGEKPFHCDLCERRFVRRVDLNVHLRRHNGEKRHWCPYCKKGFLDSNNLKRHKYIHTGEKPHPCAHCPKQFTQSAHLKKHVKNVHNAAGAS